MAKILLADDSAIAQRMGKEILSAEGFEVSTVSDGQAAANILKQFEPDLILADVFMPGRNGYELCQLVKSDPELKHTPVVLIIGKMEPYDEAEGRKAHADAVITKPLESSSLIATVQRLLASVQKPAPPPKSPIFEEPPEEEPEQEDFSSPETEHVWTTPKEEMEIPGESVTPAVSASGDLPDSGDEPEAASESSGEPDPQAELSPEPLELEVAPSPEAISTEPETVPPLVAESSVELEEAPTEMEQAPEGIPAAPDAVSDSDSGAIQAQELQQPEPQQEITPEAQQPEIQETERPVWTAEPAAATEEDEKRLEQSLPDRETVMKMAEGAEPPSAIVSSDLPEPEAPALAASAPPVSEPPISAEVEAEEEPPPVSIAPPPAPPAEENIAAEPSGSSLGIPEVEASLEEDSFPEPVPASQPLPEETEPAPATVDPALIEQHIRQSVEEMLQQITDRIVRAVDPATIEQLVRKAVEDMMPQIVDHITRSMEIILRREQVDGPISPPQQGMTLREWLAGQALSAVIELHSKTNEMTYREAADEAILYADAVIEALGKKG